MLIAAQYLQKLTFELICFKYSVMFAALLEGPCCALFKTKSLKIYIHIYFISMHMNTMCVQEPAKIERGTHMWVVVSYHLGAGS